MAKKRKTAAKTATRDATTRTGATPGRPTGTRASAKQASQNTARRPTRKPAASQSSARPADPRYVYSFGAGKADGDRSMKDLLGGKGAGLAEMTTAGLPVPPGFTITTEACHLFGNVVLDVSKDAFGDELDEVKHEYGVTLDTELGEGALREVVGKYKEISPRWSSGSHETTRRSSSSCIKRGRSSSGIRLPVSIRLVSASWSGSASSGGGRASLG